MRKCCQTPKFQCPTHRAQTNQNRVWSTERFIARVIQGEQAAHAQRPELSLMGFREERFTGKISREGCRVCNPPLVGGEVKEWCSGNINYQSSGSNRFEVRLLVFSLKLPSSTLVGGLHPCTRTHRYVSNCYAHPWEGTRTRPGATGCTIVSFCILSLL